MTDKELYKKCVEAGKYARKWKNQFVSMLPEISKRGLHRKHGFATIVEFAAKVGGVGKSTVEKMFQIEKCLFDKPVLTALIQEIGVSKIRAIAAIATKENQKDLAKKVQNMSKAALELYAQEKRKCAERKIENLNLISIPIPSPGRIRRNMNFGLDEDIEFALRKFKQDMGGEKVEWNDVIKALLKQASDKAEGIVKSKIIKNHKKCVKKSKKITRNSFNKTILSCKCTFPGCNKPAQEIHHPERFSLNPNHNNLKPLCKAHHELVHNGLEPPEWKPQTTEFIEQKYAIAKRLQINDLHKSRLKGKSPFDH